MTPERSREITERIEQDELVARSLEIQARVFEARIRLAQAKSKFHEMSAARPEDDESWLASGGSEYGEIARSECDKPRNVQSRLPREFLALPRHDASYRQEIRIVI